MTNLTSNNLSELKTVKVSTLTETEKETFKTNLLNLPKKDIIDFLSSVIDEQYKYLSETNQTEENLLVENFLADERFVEYFETLLNETNEEAKNLCTEVEHVEKMQIQCDEIKKVLDNTDAIILLQENLLNNTNNTKPK